METTLFAMTNAQISLATSEENVEQVGGFEVLDDAQLRQVGGGMVAVLLY